MFIVFGLLSQVMEISSGFDGLLGESDVFENPFCQGGLLERNACECDKFNAECVSSSCQICKCRKKTRIYRSDVRKCLTDIEARDPCKYMYIYFFKCCSFVIFLGNCVCATKRFVLDKQQ